MPRGGSHSKWLCLFLIEGVLSNKRRRRQPGSARMTRTIELECGAWENKARFDRGPECHGAFIDGREIVRIPAAMAELIRRVAES